MKVQVRLFARYREAAGRDRVELELPDGGTAEAAWDAVSRRFPVLGPYRPFTLFAVSNDYVGPDHLLREGDELSLFPPVSGGAPHPDSIQVTQPVYEKLKDLFAFESRGALEIKGKGSVEAWLLRI